MIKWLYRLLGVRLCDFCDAKVGVSPFIAEIETLDGIWKATVCKECSILLDVIHNRVEELNGQEAEPL